MLVCPTIVAGASTIGDSDTSDFAKDEGVRSKLSEEWLNAIHKHIHSYPQGKMEYLLETVKASHDAGVDIRLGPILQHLMWAGWCPEQVCTMNCSCG